MVRHGPGKLAGNLQGGKGNLENLWKIGAELPIKTQNLVKNFLLLSLENPSKGPGI